MRSLRRFLAACLKAGTGPSSDGAYSLKSLIIFGSLKCQNALEVRDIPALVSVRFIFAKIFMNFELAES